MGVKRINGIYVLGLVSGGISGYLIFHPYVMIVNYFTHPQGKLPGLVDFYDAFFRSLEPHMFYMTMAFVFFGSFTGLLVSFLFERKRKLHIIELENERKKAEIETLRRIMVTLSHYLLNANTVIGGTARRAVKNESDRDIAGSLELIMAQARRIDAVIAVLKRITEIKTADYTSEGHALMIDIAEELEKTLKNEVG